MNLRRALGSLLGFFYLLRKLQEEIESVRKVRCILDAEDSERGSDLEPTP